MKTDNKQIYLRYTYMRHNTKEPADACTTIIVRPLYTRLAY